MVWNGTERQYLRIDGSVSDRQKLIDDFNNKAGAKLFLISLRAGKARGNLHHALIILAAGLDHALIILAVGLDLYL